MWVINDIANDTLVGKNKLFLNVGKGLGEGGKKLTLSL